MNQGALEGLLDCVLAESGNFSDIFLSPGKRPQRAVDGLIADACPGSFPQALDGAETESVARLLMGDNDRAVRALELTGACDVSYATGSGTRFRANIFRRGGELAVVMRRLPEIVPSMEELGLPKAAAEAAELGNGLVLVTGGPATGKSTTLAAIIERINVSRAVHVVTLEDPVEFLHGHKAALIDQRELGIDFSSFAQGLRASLRQAPQVIMVGEIRDRETIDIALKAAESGLLVMGTMHTADCGRTVNRVVGLFDRSEERLARMRLSSSLACVISQRLLPGVRGGRVAVFEVMKNTLRVRELIMRGETGEIGFPDVIAQGDAYGMFTFEQCLASLYAKGLVTEEAVLAQAVDRARLTAEIDRIKALKGKRLGASHNLTLEGDEDGVF